MALRERDCLLLFSRLASLVALEFDNLQYDRHDEEEVGVDGHLLGFGLHLEREEDGTRDKREDGEDAYHAAVETVEEEGEEEEPENERFQPPEPEGDACKNGDGTGFQNSENIRIHMRNICA